MLCALGSSQAACWALLTAGVMPQVDRGALSSEDEATEMAGGTRVLRTAGQGAVHSRAARLGGAAGKLGYGQTAWGAMPGHRPGPVPLARRFKQLQQRPRFTHPTLAAGGSQRTSANHGCSVAAVLPCPAACAASYGANSCPLPPACPMPGELEKL